MPARTLVVLSDRSAFHDVLQRHVASHNDPVMKTSNYVARVAAGGSDQVKALIEFYEERTHEDVAKVRRRCNTSFLYDGRRSARRL